MSSSSSSSSKEKEKEIAVDALPVFTADELLEISEKNKKTLREQMTKVLEPVIHQALQPSTGKIFRYPITLDLTERFKAITDPQKNDCFDDIVRGILSQHYPPSKGHHWSVYGYNTTCNTVKLDYIKLH
jgi:predicted metal-dependent hydrolase